MKGRSQYTISEEMEVTNMTTDRSLLEDMLSDENLNKAYGTMSRFRTTKI